jgi:tRNA G10  N-methylase Trm11
MHYVFIVGSAHELCVAELQHVLSRDCILVSADYPVVIFDSPEALDVPALQKRLGGTVKIAQIIGTIPHLKAASLASFFGQSATFGISNYSHSTVDLQTLTAEIKRILQDDGHRVRYVLPAVGQTLSSIVTASQRVDEFILLSADSGYMLGKVITVQDSQDWSKRDYGRPYADPHAGMLPPKVARMMVNLSLESGKPTQIIADPFCGMGTILSEALMVGCQVIGSDLLPEVVTRAEANLQWLKSHYPHVSAEYQTLICDAVHISEKYPKNTIDAIVTEPFLGAPFERKGDLIYQKGRLLTLEMLKNTLKGLEKMYIGAFKDWYTILRENGKITIALPTIRYQEKDFSVKKVIDNCEKLGYTLVAGPLMYARPQATVRRTILVFKKA